jgi:hypothetical protein
VGWVWAWVDIGSTLVNILADLAIALESIQARALETANSIETGGILVAVVHTQGTLINVNTSDTITAETVVTGTAEWTLGVSTGGVDIAIIGTNLTLVDLMTVDTVSKETGFALAHEWTNQVVAISIDWADIVTGQTLVDVVTLESITLETRDTVTQETFVSVNTGSIGITSMCSKSTLIWISGSGSSSCGSSCGSCRRSKSWSLSGSWPLNWSGRGWLRESPDKIKTIEIGTLVGFEFDHDQIWVKDLTLEPTVLDNVIEHWVRLIVVIGKEIWVVRGTGDGVLNGKLTESVDKLTHFWWSLTTSLDTKVIPLAWSILARGAWFVVLIEWWSTSSTIRWSFFFNVHFQQFDPDFGTWWTSNEPLTGSAWSVWMIRG